MALFLLVGANAMPKPAALQPAKQMNDRGPTLDIEANIMMSMTECNSWCADGDSDWPTKCTWKTGVCSACAECSDASVANCQYWCDDHSGSWKNKCSWGSDVCSGCAECKDVDPATTGCESWCTVNGASWNAKCGWSSGSCSTCSKCDLTPSPPPSPPASTCSGSYGSFKNPSTCPAYSGHSATAGLPYCSAAKEGELCYYCSGCTCSNENTALGGYTCCAYNNMGDAPECGNSNVILEKISSLMAAFEALDEAAMAANLATTMATTKSNEEKMSKKGKQVKH